MATPPREKNAKHSAFTSADRIVVPVNAVEMLRECIRNRGDVSEVKDRIREAIALICKEAHRTEAMPEQLVVAIKELCRLLPEFDKIPDTRERVAFREDLIKLAIEEYYRV